jgi:secreted Zn-dependent insulinase-like peptidase
MWKEAIEGKPNQWSDLLYLPKPNDFLPTDFSIRHTGEKVEVVVTEDRALPVLIQREVSKLVSSSAVTTAAAAAAAAEEEEDDLESYRDLITESGTFYISTSL